MKTTLAQRLLALGVSVALSGTPAFAGVPVAKAATGGATPGAAAAGAFFEGSPILLHGLGAELGLDPARPLLAGGPVRVYADARLDEAELPDPAADGSPALSRDPARTCVRLEALAGVRASAASRIADAGREWRGPGEAGALPDGSVAGPEATSPDFPYAAASLKPFAGPSRDAAAAVPGLRPSPAFGRWHNRALRRGVDIAIGAVGTAMFLAALPFLAVAIKASSGGPVFFSQSRLAYRNREFRVWKLRTMVPGAEKLRVTGAGDNQNDPRITGLGRFLRRAKIDEWPQFAQVLLGRMSVVGFRPKVPAEVTEDLRRNSFFLKPALTEYYFHQSRGLSILPGKGADREDAANAEYVRSWSWRKYGQAFLAMFLALRSAERGSFAGPPSREIAR